MTQTAQRPGAASSGPVPDPFPLTDLQEAYLVGMSPEIELGGFRPHFSVELDVVGLDAARLARAVDRLVERHEHLRTVVQPDGRQRVLPAADVLPVRVPVADLTGLDRAGQAAAIDATRRRMAAAGLDPLRWPLFAVEVSLLRPRRARVHLGMSLLLLDAHSTWQLLHEAVLLHADPGRQLEPVPLTFRDWQLQRAGEDAGRERDRRYWRERLDTLPDAPALPLTGTLRDVSPVRFTRRRVDLPGPRWRQLCRTARGERMLPAALLAHVFAETLAAWSATANFTLAVLHQSWRTRRPEWSGVVGQLGATVPLEVRADGDPDFWERGRRLQAQLWRDIEHGGITAVEVMREVAARRGWPPRPALPYVFNSMLGVRAGGGPRVPTGVLSHTVLRTPHVLVDNQVQDTPDGGVSCVWDVVDDAFPAGLPGALFDRYTGLLEALAGSGDPAAAPPPGGRGFQARVAALNAPAPARPPERLEAGFLRRCAGQPDAPAVLAPGRMLTYGELEARSRAVAGWLAERGVGREDLVPVVMAKGWEQVVAVLGVLRAGAAYCPVDAALPEARVRHLLDECRARVVLTQSHTPAAAVGVPRLDVDRAPVGGTAPAPDGDPADLAYVIHTSGSTGRPKGVLIEHRSADGTIREVNRRVGLGPADRVFGISSLSFDLSVWDVFGTLAAGAALVLPGSSAAPAPVEWAQAAAGQGVTVWNSVPALAELLAEVAEHRPDLGRPPLRAVLVSGDWVPLTLPDRMRRLWPGLRTLALGGATEAAIWSNAVEVGQVEPSWRSIPYGTPLAGQTMRVLDPRLEVRPPWATGRIHIGGGGLARGYLGDPARTDERFLHHPGTGERLYWTGDLGRYWPDGTIEFLGREDRQVKVLGFRVEPGEVEAAVRELPGVGECVVTADPAPGGQRRLVAVVVPTPGAALDGAAVRDRLRERLPHYLVPGQVLVVPRLPLTANGKVDPARAVAAAAPSRPSAEPAGAAAAALARLWCELLDVPAVGAEDDFFALGGNSLLALRLVHRLRDELSVHLPFGQVFEARTLGALAASVDTGSGAGRSVRLAGGAGPELHLLHPVGGSIACYAELTAAWDGPVLAYPSAGLDDPAGGPGGPSDLAAIAAGHLAELRRRAPAGPYLVGGWSMGGVLAHEVGRRLAAAGEPVRIVMVDSEVPAAEPEPSARARHRAFLTDLARGRLPAAVEAGLRLAGPADLDRRARELAAAHGLLPEELPLEDYLRLLDLRAANSRALASHRPQRSPAPTLLLLGTATSRPDPVPAWRPVCPRLDVERWRVDHHGIVSGPWPARIAARVRTWLDS